MITETVRRRVLIGHESRKQAKELAKVAKAREQKECVGASVVMIY